ncbi:hypothetical protein AVEN_213520-1 [Araneus ventricosus]|uniref:Uncharacterized protein n=1 Tax=Araneus ventricosus TaxID=182803 RepID=A0A4Y2FSR9_ARAVE|nr:hypothetical protein AVEN_213520-1 [Araneus ventricosus]
MIKRKNLMKISDDIETCSLDEEFNIPTTEYISYRNRENSLLSRYLNRLLGASVFSDSCGSFIYSVYGQFARQQKPQCCLDFPIGDGPFCCTDLIGKVRLRCAQMIDMAMLELPV